MIVTNEGAPGQEYPSPISDVDAFGHAVSLQERALHALPRFADTGIARNARAYGSGGCKPSE